MFRATKVAGYLKAMQGRGVSAKQLLARTNIDPELVFNREYLISLDQYQTVILNMMHSTADPGIAFSLGDAVNVSELGILGYAMLSANSLRQATNVWLEYSNSIVGMPINAESFRDVSPGYELTISSPAQVGALHRFETEELLVQGMKLVKDITGIKPVIGKALFSYPEPSHRALYEAFCNCPIGFDAKHTVVRVFHPDLDAPIKTGNEELFSICAQHCREVMRSIPANPVAGMLRSRLRNMFLAKPGSLPDLNMASNALGISVSTLRRQLESSDQSYQAIKDEFRFDLAREYLLSGHMTPKQVGYLLGFTAPSAFSRAFKGWSGQTVGQFLAAER